MQSMFGASVSELYLLIKSLINTERTVDLCVITKKNTHAHTGTWVRPGYNTQACCTQASPAHAVGHGDGMDRWHSSHLHRAVVRRGWSPVTDTDTVSRATKTNGIDRLPCSYVYHSSHWIGKSVSGLRPCCRHPGVRLSIVHVFNSRVVFELTHDAKCAK